MDLDDEEYKITKEFYDKRKNDLQNAITNLMAYIQTDIWYNEGIKIESDFDKFCYGHCKDINTLLKAIAEYKYNEKYIYQNEIDRLTKVCKKQQKELEDCIPISRIKEKIRQTLTKNKNEKGEKMEIRKSQIDILMDLIESDEIII